MVGPNGVCVVEDALLVLVLVLDIPPVAVTEEFEKPVEVTRPAVDVPVDDVVLDGARLYNWRRFPAPQYSVDISRWFPDGGRYDLPVPSPRQGKLQSPWFGAMTLPAPRELPQ